MPANTAPVFVVTANRGNDGTGAFGARLTGANTTPTLSSTTGANLLFTAGANGSRVETVTFTHVSDNPATAPVPCLGRLWICSSSAGANPRLIAEVGLTSSTAGSNTVAQQQQSVTFSPPLYMPSGSYLWTAVSVAQTSGAYDVTIQGGDY